MLTPELSPPQLWEKRWEYLLHTVGPASHLSSLCEATNIFLIPINFPQSSTGPSLLQTVATRVVSLPLQLSLV